MRTAGRCSRRQFLGGAVALAASGAMLRVLAAENKLAFVAAGKEFAFDTGVLRGTLRGGGQSKGLIPLFDCATGTALTKSLGLFSHYRLLDDQTRYGKAAWDWVSEAKLQSNGAVEVRWTADEMHPFDMMAVYRWTTPNTFDLTTRLTARKELRKMEVFIGSYFDGFPDTVVYAGGKPSFVSAVKEAGKWQMFPRDDEAVNMIQDGRWKRGSNPVEWAIRPKLALPVAIRRDEDRKLAAVVLTRPQDCFAMACPQDEEGHRSIYMSLFGRDLKNGESVEAKSRLIIGRNITNEQALQLYEKFRSDQTTSTGQRGRESRKTRP
ncbi:MAG: hypothetical protein FJ395_15880 [Verrucomicrobia bacterium]|nr:hypothetical protein [Verrucomicrobiota bacterium]